MDEEANSHENPVASKTNLHCIRPHRGVQCGTASPCDCISQTIGMQFVRRSHSILLHATYHPPKASQFELAVLTLNILRLFRDKFGGNDSLPSQKLCFTF